MPLSLAVSRAVMSNFAVIIQTIPYFQDSALKARGCKSSSKVWAAAEQAATDKARKWQVKGFVTVFNSDLTLQHPTTWTLKMLTCMMAFSYWKVITEGYVMEKEEKANWFKQNCFQQRYKEEKLILFSHSPPPARSQWLCLPCRLLTSPLWGTHTPCQCPYSNPLLGMVFHQ